MKLSKYYYFIVSLILLVSCNSNNKKEEKFQVDLHPVEIEMTHQDTLEIADLVEQYSNLFLNNDLEGASHLLYSVKNDSVSPLSEDVRSEFVSALSIFHVYDCKYDGMLIHSDKNNEIKFTVQIMPDGDIRQDKGVTHFYLNPIKKDGHWYLTLKDPMAEGVRNIYGTND